jgi:RimJ/RimL family protein N-acetyltransferase
MTRDNAPPMDRQPTLSNGTLTLRPLMVSDRIALQLAASDPITWAGHPASDRWKPEIFDRYFDQLLASTETLVVQANNEIIGCSRYYTPKEDLNGIAIGFTFIGHAHWGGLVNRQIKTLMLAHAFDHQDKVWFHIAPDNIRSQKATSKLGANFVSCGPKTVGDTLGDWMTYTLSKTDWAAHLYSLSDS